MASGDSSPPLRTHNKEMQMRRRALRQRQRLAPSQRTDASCKLWLWQRVRTGRVAGDTSCRATASFLPLHASTTSLDGERTRPKSSLCCYTLMLLHRLPVIGQT